MPQPPNDEGKDTDAALKAFRKATSMATKDKVDTIAVDVFVAAPSSEVLSTPPPLIFSR